MPSTEADLPAHLLPVLTALLDALSLASQSGDRACLWLSIEDLADETSAPRQAIQQLHVRGLIDRRPTGSKTGARAKWVCRIRESVATSIRLGQMLPQLDPATRKGIPSASAVALLYRRR